MSYLHDLYFDCFQTAKRHSYNGWSIHKKIFNSFHEAVYPVGMTTNQSWFRKIIGHKSLTVHQICTKFDTRICLWTAFLCSKCQGDRSTRLRFIANFASVRKHEEEEKNEEKEPKLWLLVTRKWLEWFPRMWTPLAGGQLCSKFGSNWIRYNWDTMVWNWRFLPVNILTAWRAGFLGGTTLSCVLISITHLLHLVDFRSVTQWFSIWFLIHYWKINLKYLFYLSTYFQLIPLAICLVGS